ncbi:MAG: hypothetical protein KC420_04315, partial [Myxococcales bacterium]|nr:hypothetical protein [Myxococcales bacterium]
KWEREAVKPPVTDVGSLSQLILLAVFALLFVWIFSWCLMGLFGAKKSTMADKYGEMNVEGAAAPAGE